MLFGLCQMWLSVHSDRQKTESHLDQVESQWTQAHNRWADRGKHGCHRKRGFGHTVIKTKSRQNCTFYQNAENAKIFEQETKCIHHTFETLTNNEKLPFLLLLLCKHLHFVSICTNFIVFYIAHILYAA